jgi:hypothetical protein
VSPAAIVETIRHADGQRLHGPSRDRRVARAAGGENAVDPALRVEPFGERGRGLGHLRDRRAAVGGRDARGDLVARDVGLAPVRRLPRSHVGDQHVDARGLQPLAQVRVLVAFGVERSD